MASRRCASAQVWQSMDSQGSDGTKTVKRVWLFFMLSVYRVGGQRCPLVDTSQGDHHVHHLLGVDLIVIPRYAVGGLPEHPPDLSLHHATLELLPGGLVVTAEGHTRLSGIVEELVVLNPEGSVPGLVVCPTVVGRHGLSRLVDVVSLQGHGLVALQECAVHPLSQRSARVDHQA